MARYKLTFTDTETDTTYLLGDDILDYDSAVFAALDYIAEGANEANESGDASAETRLFNTGLSMAMGFGEKKGLDCVSCCGFTITRKGE